MDSLGACHLRLRGYTFEALPDAVQAKGVNYAPPQMFQQCPLWYPLALPWHAGLAPAAAMPMFMHD